VAPREQYSLAMGKLMCAQKASKSQIYLVKIVLLVCLVCAAAPPNIPLGVVKYVAFWYWLSPSTFFKHTCFQNRGASEGKICR